MEEFERAVRAAAADEATRPGRPLTTITFASAPPPAVQANEPIPALVLSGNPLGLPTWDDGATNDPSAGVTAVNGLATANIPAGAVAPVAAANDIVPSTDSAIPSTGNTVQAPSAPAAASAYTFLNINQTKPDDGMPDIVARLPNGTYVAVSSLPHAVQMAIDQEIESWKTAKKTNANKDWYNRLGHKQPKLTDPGLKCLHTKYHGGDMKWPLGHAQGTYVCMTCTNICKPCMVWCGEREEVMVLPLVPGVRDASATKDVERYWVLDQPKFTMRNVDKRDLFEEPSNPYENEKPRRQAKKVEQEGQ